MGDTQEAHNDMMQRLQPSFGTSSSSIPKQSLSLGNQMDIPHLNTSQLRARHFSQFAQNFSGDGSKRVGIPPSHPNQIPPVSPYSQIPVSKPVSQQMGTQNLSPGHTHSRSLSQPSSFFSLDSLPPLSPATFRDSSSTSISDPVSADVSMEDRDTTLHSVLPPPSFTRGNSPRVSEGLPPRNTHRRSNSDVPFGFYNVLQSSPPVIPSRGTGGLESPVPRRENAGAAKPAQLIKKESNWERGSDNNAEGMGEKKSEGEVVDDLFSAYLNLDNIDALNSPGTDDKTGNENFEDLDSKASGTKTNGADSSDNEAESSVNEGFNNMQRVGVSPFNEKREGLKRSAGGDIAPTTRHCRSVSMDSFMGKLNFGDESPKLPPSPGQSSPSNSVDGNSAAFSLEFGNGEFSGAELKKIMVNEKLAEIASTDPKRAKRILANRQSAARSKERKMRYISELEHKVQTLQTEATTLSAQLTHLQRDSIGLTNQNNELKFRLQAMKQQAQLRDALNEALTGEVRRLTLATQETSGDSDPSKCMQQLPVNPQIFQLQQQASQLNIHQFQPQQQLQPQQQRLSSSQVNNQQQQQPQSQQNNGTTPTKSEGNQ